MARAKNFLKGLSSGYVLLACSTISTLVSLPLALHFLENSEYTVWLIATQVVTYLSMIDLGTTGSGIRLLVDHKDAPAKGEYGSLIKSMWFLQLLQGVFILSIGLASAGFLSKFLKNIPSELSGDFRMLWIWQVIFLAVSFAFRIGTQILTAHQRLDISNYAQIGALILNLVILLASLGAGFRLSSFVVAQGISLLVMLVVTNAACWWLKLLPARGAWGSLSRHHLKQVFTLGGEFFLIILSASVTTGSQGLLLTRLQNIDAVLVWSVMTKTFTLCLQVVFRIVSGATPAFSEMFVRGEMDRLWKRYRSVFELCVLAGGYFGLLIGFGNDAFVKVWTNKPISWEPVNNWLLAAWLVLSIQASCHTSLLLYLKEVRWLKFVYVGEASAFVLLAVLVVPGWGISGMLLCSIVCTALLSALFGAYKVSRLINQPISTTALEWFIPVMRFLGLMLPIGIGLAYLTRESAWPRLLGCVLPLAIIGAVVALRFCLPRNLLTEILTHLPQPVRRIAVALTGARSSSPEFKP